MSAEHPAQPERPWLHRLQELFPFDWELLRHAGAEPVPYHLKKWWFCLGGTVLYLFVIQVVTGIALAFVCAAKGYRLILTMPESMSAERGRMVQFFGAEIELTPAGKGMRGAIQRAEKLVHELPDAFMPQQFQNAANPEIHARALAVLKTCEGLEND